MPPPPCFQRFPLPIAEAATALFSCSLLHVLPYTLQSLLSEIKVLCPLSLYSVAAAYGTRNCFSRMPRLHRSCCRPLLLLSSSCSPLEPCRLFSLRQRCCAPSPSTVLLQLTATATASPGCCGCDSSPSSLQLLF